MKSDRIKELNEKFYDVKNPVVLGSNMRAVMNVRTLTTIFTGLAAGLFGMNGLVRIIFYLMVDVLVGLVLMARFGFKSSPYFTSLAQIMSAGLASNVMTFMVSWIFVYNIVYVL